MTWTAPMTALTNQVLTATQYNTYIRDNLNEMAVAKATAAGQHFAVSGIHTVVARQVKSAVVTTSETTSSVAYTNLATVGPSVTVDCGENCIIWIAAAMANNTLNRQTSASVSMSGTDSEDASDAADYWRIVNDGVAATSTSRYCVARRYNNLTPGTHTFTMKYRVSDGASIGTFSLREIVALPI